MPHEENRKIIKIGETSYAIILPRSWLRYYKLTDKDHLRVTSNSNIIIEPLEKQQECHDRKRALTQVGNKKRFEIKNGGVVT